MNPYQPPNVVSLVDERILQGRLVARDLAKLGFGYGAIRHKLKKTGLGDGPAHEIARAAAHKESIQKRLTYFVLKLLGGVAIAFAIGFNIIYQPYGAAVANIFLLAMGASLFMPTVVRLVRRMHLLSDNAAQL